MEKKILYLLFVWLVGFTAYSQEIINTPVLETNEVIQQVTAPSINDIMSFQTLNQGITNFSLIQQNGNQNKAAIHQQADHGLGSSNQSYIIQEGNSNEITVGQTGNGNVLLSFQLDYLSSLPNTSSLTFGMESSVSFGTSNESNSMLSIGERNKLQVTQDGSNNGIMALQQGTGNSIDVGQKGSNNYLAVLQKGSKNSVSGYVQENMDISLSNTDAFPLFETITQVGYNNTFLATEVSGAKAMGNVINQLGSDLSLEINNGLINTMGGIEVNQTGMDMKVVVEQSYFLSPTN